MEKTKTISVFNNFFSKSLAGIVIFILVIHVITLSVANDHFSYENLGEVYTFNPLIWILYAAAGGLLWLAKHYDRCLGHIHTLSVQKEQMEKSREKALEFAKALEVGNFKTDYNFDRDDQLGDVLTNLRNRLKENKEEEIRRKKEDEQRNWISDGLAKFNDILRQDKGNDIYELSYDIISNLVKYLDAIQGGLFILNEEEEQNEENGNNADKYFELTAAYAFDRRKYHTKKIEWGKDWLAHVLWRNNQFI